MKIIKVNPCPKCGCDKDPLYVVLPMGCGMGCSKCEYTLYGPDLGDLAKRWNEEGEHEQQ